jgi:diaminopimelate decarboxylase
VRPSEHLEPFGTIDGEIAVGGMPLGRLAQRVGSTPFFAYDRRLLSERVAGLRSLLPDDFRIGYAVKANPMPAVVQHLSGLVDALDVASSGEMKVALDTGTAPEHVSFAGPGKTDSELSMAIAAGVTIELESAGEADRVVRTGEHLGVRPRVAVRVNPDFAVKGSGMRMGGGPQQFGVDQEAVPALLERLGEQDVEMTGFHVFAGSQNLSSDLLVEAQRRIVEVVLDLSRHATGPITYVNLGGGFGIPYFEKDRWTSGRSSPTSPISWSARSPRDFPTHAPGSSWAASSWASAASTSPGSWTARSRGARSTP